MLGTASMLVKKKHMYHNRGTFVTLSQQEKKTFSIKYKDIYIIFFYRMHAQIYTESKWCPIVWSPFCHCEKQKCLFSLLLQFYSFKLLELWNSENQLLRLSNLLILLLLILLYLFKHVSQSDLYLCTLFLGANESCDGALMRLNSTSSCLLHLIPPDSRFHSNSLCHVLFFASPLHSYLTSLLPPDLWALIPFAFFAMKQSVWQQHEDTILNKAEKLCQCFRKGEYGSDALFFYTFFFAMNICKIVF